MKKIALVAALAAIAAPAFAQSSVTLYGRLNTTVESQKIGTADRKIVVANNASRIGFMGKEELGGGLSAGFDIEHGFNSDDGKQTGTAFWNRESSVYLAGSFGTVRLGSWTPASYFATADYVSMHNHDTGSSSDALYSGAGFTQTNKVAYKTPTISGFNAEFALHAGEGAPGEKKGYDLGAYYDQGPIHLGLGYSKQGVGDQLALRGLFEMGAWVFGGYIQQESVDGLPASQKDTRLIGRASVMYTMGASEFHLNYGGSKAGGYLQGSGAEQYTLAYNYNLSKRTKIYGYYTAIQSSINSRDFSSYAAGIRHNF
ncbi:porin [Roseateles violae]|uniref:Porin n=1 Tax=Roseateles violae TaxID=3058042 RepID=A0ABT8DRC9_9BURK|nr:porin [Pelomonas sp. PFR6]MDN3918676.1 porin [Pelomonas sp. PFR6]